MPSLLSSKLHTKTTLSMSVKAQPDPEGEGVTPLDCIFACSVCGDSFSDLYQEHDTVHGLSDGINPRERLVTRLYVASCCHVICIKHIESGSGPAFHKAGQQPQASCPVCIRENSDDTLRQLFSVRGFNKDEHDPAIPQFWFKAPPMKLEGKDKEMEALRFQYLALIRYSKNVTIAYKRVMKDTAECEAKLRSMQDLASGKHAKALSLEHELEELRPLQREVQKLHRLEARLPAIEHYLKLLPKLAEQNDMMQHRLASLGISMSLEPIPNFNEPFPLDANGNFVEEDEDLAYLELQKTGSSHTIGGSTHHTGVEELEATSNSQSQRPLKRSRLDSPVRANSTHATPSSRDLMPPPSKPLSRMKSIRKIIPNIRNKLSNGRLTPARARKPVAGLDIQMYDNDQCENVNYPMQLDSVDERPPSRHRSQPRKQYMSGALPAGHGRQVNTPSQSRLLTGLGIYNSNSDFTFEVPSQAKLKSQRSGELPAEPSYIRLLDGLGHDTNLDLGLEDPRCSTQVEQSIAYQASQREHQAQPNSKTQNHRHWHFGHAFLQQSPVNANSSSAQLNRDLDHSRQTHGMIVNGHPDRDFTNPVTPAPTRFRRPADGVDSVFNSLRRLSIAPPKAVYGNGLV
ncbi:hypothetical protein N0V90_008274 [Kalmusia sp. IMI 367209]|nr:hypothetical protein N0V90_008274 [Kalmusia sp. IMI 367209]